MSDNDNNNDAATTRPPPICTITFNVHPQPRTLYLSLHQNVSNPVAVASNLLSNYNNSHNDRPPSVALCNPQWIVSLSQVAVAAHMALLREQQQQQQQQQQQKETQTQDSSKTTPKRTRRSLALDTIVCCASASTNASHVLRDYAFQKQQQTTKEEEEEEAGGGAGAAEWVLALGLDCTSPEQFWSLLEEAGLDTTMTTRSHNQVEAHFAQRSFTNNDEERATLLKIYKVSKEEMEAFSLEQAILTRIATKFVT